MHVSNFSGQRHITEQALKHQHTPGGNNLPLINILHTTRDGLKEYHIDPRASGTERPKCGGARLSADVPNFRAFRFPPHPLPIQNAFRLLQGCAGVSRAIPTAENQRKGSASVWYGGARSTLPLPSVYQRSLCPIISSSCVNTSVPYPCC